MIKLNLKGKKKRGLAFIGELAYFNKIIINNSQKENWVLQLPKKGELGANSAVHLYHNQEFCYKNCK